MNDAKLGTPDVTRDFAAGNYRFIPAVFQYSSGAAAHPGFEIERVRFDLGSGKVEQMTPQQAT